MIISKVLENNFGLITLNTKEITKMVKNKERENLFGVMAQNLKENSKII